MRFRIFLVLTAARFLLHWGRNVKHEWWVVESKEQGLNGCPLKRVPRTGWLVCALPRNAYLARLNRISSGSELCFLDMLALRRSCFIPLPGTLLLDSSLLIDLFVTAPNRGQGILYALQHNITRHSSPLASRQSSITGGESIHRRHSVTASMKYRVPHSPWLIVNIYFFVLSEKCWLDDEIAYAAGSDSKTL